VLTVVLALVAVAAGACTQLYDLSALGPADRGDAEAGADTSPGDAGPLVCPTGNGPPMIPAGSFCIDATEVTNEQYKVFLSETTGKDSPTLPAECDFKQQSFDPTDGWPPAADAGVLPVRYVDWCDALAYCLWAGKRLCGRVGAGPLRAAQAVDPAKSEWAAACTGGRSLTYPYGTSYVDGGCNARGGVPLPSFASCEGGVPGLFDMVGNVAEWINACEGNSGPLDTCIVAGGSFDSLGENAKCSLSTSATRTTRRPDQGIRCCGP
jgi:formylglycine-generating enzyme